MSTITMLARSTQVGQIAIAMSAWGRRTYAFGAVLALFVGCFVLEAAAPELRYLKYFLPAAAALLVAGAPRTATPMAIAFRERFGSLIRLVAICVAISLIVTLAEQSFQQRLLEEAYFLLAPLIAAYLIFPHLDPRRIPAYVRASFLGTIAAYLIEYQGDIFELVRQPSQLAAKFLLSSGGAESGISFVFGAYCIYFLSVRARSWSLLSFALVVLSFKRIAIFGVVVAGLVYFVHRNLKIDVLRYRRALPIAFVAINALLLLVLYELGHGALDDAVRDYTGLDANWVTMGRAEMYDAIFSNGGMPWFGRGLGSITLFLQAQGMQVGNAHSDVIKYAVELGPIVSGAMIYAFYRRSLRTIGALMLMIYVNVVFITDNISIYFKTMFVFYVLQGFSDVAVLAGERE